MAKLNSFSQNINIGTKTQHVWYPKVFAININHIAFLLHHTSSETIEMKYLSHCISFRSYRILLNILLLACISLRNPLTLPRIPLVLVRIPLSLPRNPLQAVDSTISSWPMQRIPRFCLIVNWNREKLYTAVFVPEFHAANFALCGWHVLKLGPGFHCSNGSTLSCTKSVGLCVVMTSSETVQIKYLSHCLSFRSYF